MICDGAGGSSRTFLARNVHSHAPQGMNGSIPFGGKCLRVPIVTAAPGEKRGKSGDCPENEYWRRVLIRPSPPLVCTLLQAGAPILPRSRFAGVGISDVSSRSSAAG